VAQHGLRRAQLRGGRAKRAQACRTLRGATSVFGLLKFKRVAMAVVLATVLTAGGALATTTPASAASVTNHFDFGTTASHISLPRWCS